VKQGTTWHPATDDLRGTDVYGTYGTATSDATFSIAFASIITPTTEILLITGIGGVVRMEVREILVTFHKQVTGASG
jgi:hypothetical protein